MTRTTMKIRDSLGAPRRLIKHPTLYHVPLALTAGSVVVSVSLGYWLAAVLGAFGYVATLIMIGLRSDNKRLDTELNYLREQRIMLLDQHLADIDELRKRYFHAQTELKWADEKYQRLLKVRSEDVIQQVYEQLADPGPLILDPNPPTGVPPAPLAPNDVQVYRQPSP